MPTPVLENARLQVAGTAAQRTGGVDDTAGTEGTPTEELPAPDPSTFVGSNRIVNLMIGAGAAEIDVDVWGRRTFSNGPILLADGVGFGEATEYFSAPANYELSIVGAGAGPDGAELAGVINAIDGEQVTTVFTNDDLNGSATRMTMWEVGDRAPDLASDDTGLVIVASANLSAVDDELVRTFGADTLAIGDETGTCLLPRGQRDGDGVASLSATGRLELELAPGPAQLTLHAAADPDGCAGEPVHGIEVDVVAGDSRLVMISSVDGTDLDSLVLVID